MKSFVDKFFFRRNNLDSLSNKIKDISKKTPVSQIFNAISSYSSTSELRYVGGCIRKIINNENFDDIDLATNIDPTEVCSALKKNNIEFYESGIDHGTITAIIENYKFEITSLREDILTDGRHAKVKFSNDWKIDASRRDFTINSIYSDKEGNLFDPYNGYEDIKKGKINFIGNPEKRIKEDYLRILRYLRFFLNYSKQPHDTEIIKVLKMNLIGISNLSKERLIDELKKILKPNVLESLSKDKIILEILVSVFPQLKYFNIFSKLNTGLKNILSEVDFIFIISLLIIDETDNVDYFIYKFNLSKKDQKRITNIRDFYKKKMTSKTFTEKNLNSIFYYSGKETVIDILNYRILKSNKLDNNILVLINKFRLKSVPTMPFKADFLMSKYDIPEGKKLGEKLKLIENKWVENNFQISEKQIENIISN
tara:strand:+ start:43 stop:1317 length:1275 start_codon:yes stop_codon:yes gene_type:complete